LSRGYDGFDFDDFRGSTGGFDRDVSRGSSSGENGWIALQYIHREEERADRLDLVSRKRPALERPSLPREVRVREILSQRVRSTYADRDKDYPLRDSEIHALAEIGKFRVVGTQDLTEFAYNGDHSRMENDIENLVAQGFAHRTQIPDTDYGPREVLTLTKQGHRFLARGKVTPSGQATYYGVKKPKEALHDADLYRLYHKAADEIELAGGHILRVKLDYEIKEELYSRLARAARGKTRDPSDIRKSIAKSYHLKPVGGRIPIPDLRIEYLKENDSQIQHRDLELATDHYRPQGLAQKARAGFQIYARHHEADRLRRIRDEQELSATIFRI
jgi:hypothetical protein